MVGGKNQRVDEFVLGLMAIGLSIAIVKRIVKAGCRGCLMPPPGFLVPFAFANFPLLHSNVPFEILLGIRSNVGLPIASVRCYA